MLGPGAREPHTHSARLPRVAYVGRSPSFVTRDRVSACFIRAPIRALRTLPQQVERQRLLSFFLLECRRKYLGAPLCPEWPPMINGGVSHGSVI